MGYTSNHSNYLDLDMKQTPLNLYVIREQAGYSRKELSMELQCKESMVIDAESGIIPVPGVIWNKILKICGTRAFDHEVD